MFNFIRKSFSAKIITLVVVNVVITSVFIGVVTMHTTERFLRDRVSEKFPSILVNCKGKLDLWYHNAMMDLAVLARAHVLVDKLRALVRSYDQEEAIRAERDVEGYFNYVRSKFPMYKDFAILAPSYDLAYATSDSARSYAGFLRNLKEVHGDKALVSEAILSPEEHEIPQWILIPVRLDEKTVVTVCAKFYLKSIEHLLADINLSPYGDIYIVDLAGRFLTQPRLVTVSVLGEKGMEVPTREQGPLRVEKYTNYANKQVFGSKVFLPDKKWWLICEEDYRKTMGPVLGARNQILIADLFICALFILVAIKIIRSILRPVQALSDGAKKVKEGMVGVKIGAASDDEVGLMISTFNEMARTISLAKVELQAKNKMLNTQNETLQNLNEKLERLSITDGLTGLFNHRHFWNILNSELTRANLYKGNIALILIDVDDFKKVNDQFGHSVGDQLLQRIADKIKETVRETDIVARYGGEEFAILLPDTDRDGVIRVAEKTRTAVESMSFKIPETGISIRVTISLGVSVFDGNRRDFFNAADRALYVSKNEGKNRVSMASA